MKKALSLIIATVFLMCFFSGCNTIPESEPTPQGADDFSFSLTWGTRGISSYDSSTGKLVKTNHATNPDDFVTTYVLTEAEMTIIRDLIRDLNIESYPDDYDPDGSSISFPSSTVILTVRMGGVEKTVCAKGISLSEEATNEKGQLFLDTAKAIEDILTETDEWKALPDYEYLYY